ncbi:extracellular solute-binding protein [Paenibacillus sp. HB172176]|uniref:extracellular solute-binding protein n=1 Tax=Paenibacillus sp. HB172176 TaxID=2493690 RepID=UPI00143BC014|nr:extracellular solute-binding protein [Paenibacillus sp. HB172176]
MKKVWKKGIATTAIVTALAMLSGACSGGSSGNGNDNPAATNAPSGGSSSAPTESAGGGKLFDKPMTFKWLVSDRKEAPVRNDWPVFDQIRELTNVTVEFEPVADGMAEKQQILIATNSVPDFMLTGNTDARAYGPDGVFLDLSKYLDIAPNLKAYYEEYPEAKAVVTGSDGGLYGVPMLEGTGFNYSWIVRRDLMDKYGIKDPTNPDEFYNMLKTLKEHHPDTYPLVPERATNLSAENLFSPFLTAFTGLSGLLAFDPNQQEYVFAPESSGFKDTLEYMNKLYDEKLLDPEFLIMKSAQWEERMLSGKGLVSWFWKTRIQMFNNNAEKAGMIDGYEMDTMPLFASPGIEPYLFSRNMVSGSGITISGKIKDPEAAVRFLDFLMGERGSDLLSLGIEGETYERVNGEAKFLESLGPAPYSILRGDYGIWYPGIALDFGKSREAEVLSEAAQRIEDLYLPRLVEAPKSLVMTPAETDLEKAKKSNLNTYMDQKISEFIAGRTPINDNTIKAFVDQSVKLGAHELRDMYNASYQRTYGGS